MDYYAPECSVNHVMLDWYYFTIMVKLLCSNDEKVSSFQDEHPPIPDSLSPDITDFLRQCFKKVKCNINQILILSFSIIAKGCFYLWDKRELASGVVKSTAII